ncbi:helix-turn-helix domain-containing protein [Halobiforma nitratireducens]|uniref:Bacterio-opsin activator HTH domain-containing protein n=1 Tax=Halobiforma nitratireducens JCM 10879 TaxID=1227454 RepID=M0MBB2_9EURY|nr:helix-turn-helix domain-containing protein [Halobiforma nitratireducens]EMA41695.1 bacterio-opsin activator HTH domain-containing protein [Halobiforma nitratireducens JCM 10879]
MLVARYVVSATVLHSTLAEFPDILLQHEAQYLTSDGTVRLLCWVSGVDCDRFEDALEGDTTVAAFDKMATGENRDFYRIDFTEAGRRKSTFPRWNEDGVVLLEARGTNDGWRVRMQFPDRSTLVTYRRQYVDNGCSFTLLSLQEGRSEETGVEAMLSPSQREALSLAYEAGYFEVPRGITQTELGNRLGITSQSVSERLRRAVSTLLEVVFPDGRT